MSYKSVTLDIARNMGESGGLSAEEETLARRWINLFVRLAWEAYWWPDVCPIEKRVFRQVYSAVASYAAPTLTQATEVYWPGDGNYYQTLQASTGQAPAIASGPTWNVNAPFWSVSQAEYGGDDWVSGGVYTAGTPGVAGSVVRNPSDGRFYECITSHTAGGSFDATKFGVLTPFVRSLDDDAGISPDGGATNPIGEIRFIWDKDPEVFFGASTARTMPFHRRQGFTQVLGRATLVWLEHRLRPSVYDGATISATSGYPSGVTVYDPATGDFWTTTTNTNAGDTPSSQPGKFSKVAFPYVFGAYTAMSAYAAMSNKEQQTPEDYNVMLGAGWPLLKLELDKLERQQGQVRQLNVARR